MAARGRRASLVMGLNALAHVLNGLRFGCGKTYHFDRE